MFTAMFLPSLSLINLLLFPLSSFCSVIQNETDVLSKCDDPDDISKIAEEASETFMSCLSSISDPSNKEEFYKFVCTDMAQTGYICLNGLIEDGCINTNFTTLSEHYLRVFNATINEQCEGGKEEFMGRAPAIEDMSCKPNFVEWSIEIYQKCFPSLGFEVLFPNLRAYSIWSLIGASHSCEYSKIQECIFGILNGACRNRALNVYGFKLMKQGLILCEIIPPDGPVQDDTELLDYLISFVFYAERKCYLNAGKKAFQQIELASNFKGKVANPELSAESFYEFVCLDLPTKLYPYLENLLGKLVHCLEPESKFLSEFVLGGLNDTIAQVCTSEDTFAARINELDNVNCYMNTTSKDLTYPILNVCLIPKTTFLKNGYSIDPEIIITKSLICSELKLVIDCIKETLENACDSDKVARYVLGFLQPFLNSCSEDIRENLI